MVNKMKIDYKAVRWSRINLFRVVVNQIVREMKGDAMVNRDKKRKAVRIQ